LKYLEKPGKIQALSSRVRAANRGTLALTFRTKETKPQKSFDSAAFGGYAQDDSVLGCFAQFQLLIRIVK